MSMPQIILAHPVRTAIGSYNGALKGAPVTELGAIPSVRRCAGLPVTVRR